MRDVTARTVGWEASGVTSALVGGAAWDTFEGKVAGTNKERDARYGRDTYPRGRAGYRREGVLRSVHFKEGRRIDLGIWSLLRSDEPNQ